jgi:chemotaxis signal transduction protein
LSDDIVDALRRSFDGGFAAPRSPPEVLDQRYLTIQVETLACALPLGQVAGVLRTPPLVQLPTTAPGLVGLAAVRGVLVAVFSLGAVLGLRRRRAPGAWIALCAAAPSVALTFDQLEGQLATSRDRIARQAGGSSAVVVEQVFETTVRSVIDLDLVLKTIRGRGAPGSNDHE